MRKEVAVLPVGLEANLEITADLIEQALHAPMSHEMRVASVVGALHGMVLGLVIDFPALRGSIERLNTLLSRVYE